MTLLSILGLGFVLGMRHATDSDHVVAVSTIVSRERSAWAATLIGALWGVGHTFTIMVVGGAIIVFDLVIPARLGLSMELSVGVMLVVLGALNLSGAWKRIDEAAHAHTHHYGRGARGAHAEHASALGLTWLARPLFVGVVHGLAGSAAVALLVLTTIRNVQTALLYLAVFGLGTVVGMAVLTTAFAAPLAFAASRNDRINGYMARATGALSLAFGMLVLYKIGIVDGLFTSNPHWTPR
jgi:high-affinity nickel-transport protein